MPKLPKRTEVKPIQATASKIQPATHNCKQVGNDQLPPLRVREPGLANLRASGLGDATIRANGLYTEADPVRLATLLNCLPYAPPKEIPMFCRGGGLVFPYRDLDGSPIDFVRVRPHTPRKRKGKNGKDKDGYNKYESTWGSECHVYVPVECLGKLKGGICPVLIPEGEKKALALVQLGYCAVAVGGVNCGLKKDGTLVDELAAIPWHGRLAYIPYDYDKLPRTRRLSLMAASKLAAALKKAGARQVYFVKLPPGPAGEKQGVADYLKGLGLSVRRKTFDRLLAEALPVPDCVAWTLRNFREETVKDGKNKDESDKFRTVRVGLTVKEIHTALTEETGDWPKAVNRLLFVTAGDGYDVLWLEKPTATYAWIGGQLPNPLQWADGTDKVTKGEFDAYLRQAADNYRGIELYPHHPPFAGHYYLHPPVCGGDGRALGELLDRFNPATEVDRDLILAATLVMKLASTCGGHIDIDPDSESAKVMTRILSPGSLLKRVALIDNLKDYKFSWPPLESWITNDALNGHVMYHGDGTRPNTLTWFITLNRGSLSKDLADRSVVILVKRPEAYSPSWDADVQVTLKKAGARWSRG
jgi:hypothetical protein